MFCEETEGKACKAFPWVSFNMGCFETPVLMKIYTRKFSVFIASGVWRET